jgi:hypothetical protein
MILPPQAITYNTSIRILQTFISISNQIATIVSNKSRKIRNFLLACVAVTPHMSNRRNGQKYGFIAD